MEWAGVLAALALALGACSSSNATASGDDGGEDATTCNPFPLNFAVPDDDCVAIIPNPCCAAFIGFDCAQQGDAGGQLCSETTTCARAARYDQSLCGGGTAYSCPITSGEISAELPSPPCTQMETIGPAGEGIRWCCGGTFTPPNLEAGAPPPPQDSGGGTGPGDASGDALPE